MSILPIKKLFLGIDDVKILRSVCEEFRQLMGEITSWNCFATASTLSTFLHTFYRYTFLKNDKTIPTIPEHGYQSKAMTSQLASGFLQFLEEDENVKFQRAPNERRFDCFTLDGKNFSILCNKYTALVFSLPRNGKAAFSMA